MAARLCPVKIVSDNSSGVPGAARHLGVISMVTISFCFRVIGSRLIKGINSAVGLTYSRGAILITVVRICGI